MEVKLAAETYFVKEIDESGLIPKEATTVMVDYNPNKSVKSVYYGPFDKKDGESLEERHERINRESEEMNSRELTQEEKEKVAGLLKKLSSE